MLEASIATILVVGIVMASLVCLLFSPIMFITFVAGAVFTALTAGYIASVV